MMTKGIADMLRNTLGIDPTEIQNSVARMGQLIVAMHQSQLRAEKMVRAIYDEKFPDTDPAGIRIASDAGNGGLGDPPTG